MSYVVGTDKSEWLFGTGEADVLRGLGGNDTLKGGGGADALDGGAGVDTVSYADSSAGVTIDLEFGTALGGTAQGDTLVSIENVYGSGYTDLLRGNSAANTLTGGDGTDQLYGRNGDDVLNGDYGADLLVGGWGRDTLNGGEGFDGVVYTDSPVGVLISLITDVAWGGTADGDDLNSIENVYGSNFSDTLIGDDGLNFLWGFAGDDSLKGYGGSDELAGFEGRDFLQGMDGDDRLFGGTDNDTLLGGLGLDTLRGEDGADTFAWYSANETGLTAATADIVRDFSFAQGDRIDLGLVDADVYAAGDQAFRFIGTAAFSGTPGEINYYHSGGNTYIQMQTGTSADVEGVIRLDGILVPEASWFFL